MYASLGGQRVFWSNFHLGWRFGLLVMRFLIILSCTRNQAQSTQESGGETQRCAESVKFVPPSTGGSGGGTRPPWRGWSLTTGRRRQWPGTSEELSQVGRQGTAAWPRSPSPFEWVWGGDPSQPRPRSASAEHCRLVPGFEPANKCDIWSPSNPGATWSRRCGCRGRWRTGPVLSLRRREKWWKLPGSSCRCVASGEWWGSSWGDISLPDPAQQRGHWYSCVASTVDSWKSKQRQSKCDITHCTLPLTFSLAELRTCGLTGVYFSHTEPKSVCVENFTVPLCFPKSHQILLFSFTSCDGSEILRPMCCCRHMVEQRGHLLTNDLIFKRLVKCSCIQLCNLFLKNKKHLFPLLVYFFLIKQMYFKFSLKSPLNVTHWALDIVLK